MRFRTIIIMFASGFFLAAKCKMGPQNPADIFLSGELPEALESVANPKPSVERWRQWLDAQATPEEYLRVAVIDNGVDYLHRDLFEQIAFQSDEAGDVIGVGKDVVGGDAWPHPTIIDPLIFAFGSKGIEKGKISEPLHDPLGLLDEFMGKFAEEFFPRLRVQEFYGDGLFKKLNENNFNLIGAYYLLQIKNFDKEGYEKQKEAGSLITSELKKSSDSSAAKLWRYYTKQTWILGNQTGLPWFIERNLWSFARADEFSVFLDEFFQSFDKKHGFTEEFVPLFDYAELQELTREDAVNKLHQAWYQRKFGYNDHALGLAHHALDLCQRMSDEDFEVLRDDSIGRKEKKAVVKRLIAEEIKFAKAFDDVLKNSYELKFEDRKEARARIALLENYQTDIHKLAESDEWRLFECRTENYLKILPELQSFSRTYRSFLQENDLAQPVHGTHVSGIVAAQDPGLRIVPVRVITQGMKGTSEQVHAIRLRFLRQWQSWMKQDDVYPAVYHLMKKDLGFPEDITAVEIDEAIETMQYRLSKIAVDDIEARPLDYQFVDEVVEAIRYVGREQIPIANISLGTEFESVPTSFDEEDVERNLKVAFDYLKFEYFKYRVAKTVVEEAPNTLFVIAAGNSGKWVDSKARSALPCDVSSEFLRDSPAAPNNRLTNVLCVGSLTPKGRISSFSNLVLTNLPFVFSRGEAWQASITNGSCQGSDQKLASIYGETPDYPNSFSESLSNELIEKLSGSVPEDVIEKNDALRDINLRLSGFLPVYHSAFSKVNCARDEQPSAYLSGTSMASPAVAGQLGARLRREMVANGLLESDLASRPQYTPSALVDRLIDKTQVYGGSSIISRVPVIQPILGGTGGVR